MADERDFAQLVIEGDEDAILARLSSRALVIGNQQAIASRWAAANPDLLEHSEAVKAEMEKLRRENAGYQGHPEKLLADATANLRGFAAAQKADAERATAQQQREETQRAAAEFQREADLDFARTMSDASREHARSTGQLHPEYAGLGVAFNVYDPASGTSRAPRDGEDQSADDELDRYVAEQNRPLEELKAIHAREHMEAAKLTDENRRRGARGMRGLTASETESFLKGQR